MKKWALLLLVIIGLLFTSAYIFFPTEITSSHIEEFNCSINSVNRFLIKENHWEKWWPGTVEHDDVSGKNIYDYNGDQYTIIEKKYNAFVLQTKAPQFTLESGIFFIPTTLDTVRAEWKYSLKTSSNPVYRINLYWQTKKIDKNIANIMKSMKAFLDKPENVYGIHIDEMIVKDTILVTTNFLSPQYPSTEIIYNHIQGIKSYISANHAEETNSPMLHVVDDSGLYKVQVAIPVSKTIPGTTMYPIKRMVPGKILVAEVKGGVNTANQALKQLGMYMSDFHLSSPAIPFESLITNRMQETDTSKWITKIYYPVF